MTPLSEDPKPGGITCIGEINGRPLGRKEDQDVRCPRRAELAADDNDGARTPRQPHDSADNSPETVTIPGTLSHTDYRGDSETFSGKHIDIYHLYTTSDGEVTIEMHSTAIDSYLIVALMNPDGENIDDFFHSDDTGNSLNATVTFHKQAGREYVILTTSANREETGPYELRFSGFERWEIPDPEYGVAAASIGASPALLQKLENRLAD